MNKAKSIVARLLGEDGQAEPETPAPKASQDAPPAAQDGQGREIDAIVSRMLAQRRIQLFKTEADGTREYTIVLDNPRMQGDLVVHPADKPETWDYRNDPPDVSFDAENNSWYVKTTLYRDKDWYDMVGEDIEDIALADLEDWIVDNTIPADPDPAG
jgi:hypothetical protein